MARGRPVGVSGRGVQRRPPGTMAPPRMARPPRRPRADPLRRLAALSGAILHLRHSILDFLVPKLRLGTPYVEAPLRELPRTDLRPRFLLAGLQFLHGSVLPDDDRRSRFFGTFYHRQGCLSKRGVCQLRQRLLSWLL